jgi:hypothetical protein
MIGFITLKSYFVSIIQESFISLGFMHQLPVITKYLRKIKTHSRPCKFHVFGHIQWQPFIPVTRVTETYNYVYFQFSSLCFYCFHSFCIGLSLLHGNQGLWKLKRNSLRKLQAFRLLFLGKYVFLALIKNNNFNFFLNCTFDLMIFYGLYNNNL